MKHRNLLAFVAGVSLLTACQGLKEALTAHVDVVARAESQELSVTRVSELLGKAKLPVPVSRDNVGIVSDLWVNYQLLGYAAAHGDSLTDHKSINQAVAGITRRSVWLSTVTTPSFFSFIQKGPPSMEP